MSRLQPPEIIRLKMHHAAAMNLWMKNLLREVLELEGFSWTSIPLSFLALSFLCSVGIPRLLHLRPVSLLIVQEGSLFLLPLPHPQP